ncbi:O-Methyltransferase involved in polyketide biosynthesis [Nannocystis exedens]|uniref:O-Methyltransferase involved in polyketide biosynthesis n=1 Tax=Nannocystis exedens TaxID=54 RepID=A0A1I2A046_9BACT|nr:class I SAM-dependent methyltransferase [Nannocystis exedens]PCC75257.1 methyltransferase [Nannocystis exedens]SFE36293.1 O-Methyltransferase involved in polyketide biosynthesis [Nannocystis exedens]
MTPEKVTLTAEKETLLITLCAKAGESRLPDSLLRDEYAARAVERIDYDFKKLKVDRNLMIGVSMRAHIFDGWTREFLARHPAATVLHMGCGLDTRVFRVDPGPGVRWFDVDYPEVIALRERLYPAREGYAMIPTSVTGPGWIEEIPADRPTLILAEGLMMYVGVEAVPRLVSRLLEHFAHGELAFDGFSKRGARMILRHQAVKATGASMHWTIEEPRALEREFPKLRLIDDYYAYDPRGYDPRQVARLSWAARVAVKLFTRIPALGRISRLLRYRF